MGYFIAKLLIRMAFLLIWIKSGPGMTPDSIDYHLFGTHVRFADGCAAQLGDEIRALGCSRPVVLMQARLAASPRVQALQHSLEGMAVLQIDSIPQHSSVSVLEALVPQIADHRPDCIVAVGGGSQSDSAKALALLLAEGGQLADHATQFTPPATVHIPQRTQPKLPIITLPVTASGAEVTPSFGILDHDHKLLFWNRQLASTTLLIDPQLAGDVPLPLLRATAMNGLAHCFEGMYSRHKSLVSNGIALQSLALFARAFATEGLADDEQRRLILLAGHLSGLVLSMARTCLHHAICHVIGARHGVGHGAVNTVILPHALSFNHSVVKADLAPALAVLNQESGTNYNTAADWTAAMIARAGMPATLSELGVAEADLPAIARQTMTERGLALNPRPVDTPDDVLSILRQAL